MKIELEKFTKACDEEAEKMRIQQDTDTGRVLQHHEQHMSRVIGRQLTAQARRQATPSVKLDPTIGKIEVWYSVAVVIVITNRSDSMHCLGYALCGLRGCKNKACCISWPEVIKSIPNQDVACFVSYDMSPSEIVCQGES